MRGASVAGWLLLFVLLDAFLLLTVPGSPVRLADAELCACLWVLCAVAVLTCAPAMTNSGALQGADWSFHLSRIEGIAQGLREGQFPVRVYSIAKDGYGYAPSLFYGELLLYFPAVLRLLGMSVQGAYHTYLLTLQLLTAGIAFFSLRQIFRHNKTALVGSVLYMLSTYHLYKIYWLSAVGEYTAMAFLPLIPAALYELYGGTSAYPQAAAPGLRRTCCGLWNAAAGASAVPGDGSSGNSRVLPDAVPPDVQQGSVLHMAEGCCADSAAESVVPGAVPDPDAERRLQ